MKRKLVILLLATVAIFFAAALPVSAATTADGFVYTICEQDSGDYVEITGYNGSGGDITIPAQIEGYDVFSINNFVFAGKSSITGVVFPDVLMHVGAYAFSDCTNLTSITVGKLFSELGEHAFENCTALTTINWNAKFVFFDSYSKGCFANAGTAGTGIHIIFNDDVEGIPDRLFYTGDAATAPKVVSVTFGDNIERIGQSAFINCPLTSVEFPENLMYISYDAFAGCPLTSVTFNDGLSSIYPYAFSGGLFSSLAFPDSLENISASAFADCTELTTVDFGDIENLYIINNAFLNCPKLTLVTIPKGVRYIGENALGYSYQNSSIEKAKLTITGYTYSAAEQYAKDNGFTFISLGGVFADVEAGSWYEPYVNDLVAQGIFSGYKDDDGGYSFKPGKNITRAEFAMILARASGDDLTPYENTTSFTDVEATGWAGTGIEWAYQNEIVYGTGSGKYAPNANISREDMALMIYRFADSQSIALNSTVGEATFTDQSKISDYALNAVSSLQKAGIINGSESQGKLYFYPKNGATRAEAATVISSLLDL